MFKRNRNIRGRGFIPAPVCLFRKVSLRPCIGSFKLSLKSPVMVAVPSIFPIRHNVGKLMTDNSQGCLRRNVDNAEAIFPITPVPSNHSHPGFSNAPRSFCKVQMGNAGKLKMPRKFFDVFLRGFLIALNLIKLRPGTMLPSVGFPCAHDLRPFKDQSEFISDDEIILSNDFSENEIGSRFPGFFSHELGKLDIGGKRICGAFS